MSGSGKRGAESGSGKAGQVRYWQYWQGSGKRKAGQVRYWQYWQAGESPSLAISDLSRFPHSEWIRPNPPCKSNSSILTDFKSQAPCEADRTAPREELPRDLP